MNKSRVLEQLLKLEICEVYIVKIYEKAYSEIDNCDILTQIKNICQDHAEHQENLQLLREELNNSFIFEHSYEFIPRLKKTIYGSGIDETLKLLLSNEKIMNSMYLEMFSQDLTEDVYAQIENNYDDEQDHISYIEEILAIRSKESGIEI